jgi:vacuolar-type H+-ATPase subunit I/STV1
MESVLKKVGEFSGVVGEFRDMVIKTIKDVSETKEALELTKIEQDTRNEELNAREVEIKKVEDIIALNESTKKILAEVETKTRDLSIAQVAFSDSIAKQKTELNEIIVKCKREQELINQEHAAIDLREKKIKEDQLGFMARLMAKMGELK